MMRDYRDILIRNSHDDDAECAVIVIEDVDGNNNPLIAENGNHNIPPSSSSRRNIKVDREATTATNGDHHHHHESSSSSPPAAGAADSDQHHGTGGGSSLRGAVFNFTNCIVGAGAIGLGGAFAESGGLISICCIIFFAILTKLSLDLVMQLSLEQQQQQQQQENGADDGSCSPPPCSYEDLGRIAFGWTGYMTVLTSKFMYASGCLVAYIVVVKDNFGPAVKSLIYGKDDGTPEIGSASVLYQLLSNDFWLTWLMSFVVILPLCMLRDMTPLASFSAVGIVSVISIVGIIMYLFFVNPNEQIRENGGSMYENWLEVRWLGFLESLGTFVFSFVSQHTVHLAFNSLRPELQTLPNWKKVSSCSLGISGMVSLLVGLFAYMTFWEATRSDLFELYPPIPIIDMAKLLLCITMLLTFPLPFFTCRELLIVLCTGGFVNASSRRGSDEVADETDQEEEEEGRDGGSASAGLREPLLPLGYDEAMCNNNDGEAVGHDEECTQSADHNSFPTNAANADNNNSILLPGDDRQLKLPYHIALTAMLWVVVTGLAIAAPSLGDVLDLVGCASGTIIAFIFPGLLSFRLQQLYSCTAITIFVVGGAVGVVGTVFSTKKLIGDIQQKQ